VIGAVEAPVSKWHFNKLSIINCFIEKSGLTRVEVVIGAVLRVPDEVEVTEDHPRFSSGSMHLPKLI
jgi:hypothetical protein